MNNRRLLFCAGFILALATSMNSHAVKPWVITCGDGKTIEVADSVYTPSKAASLCLTAGHPKPVQSTGQMGVLTTGGSSAADNCSGYDPNDARLPTGTCKEPQKVIKYDPNCARLEGCSDSSGTKSTNTLKAPTSDGNNATLLLPAVIRAKEAPAAGKVCDTGSSISAALDQCGKKGNSFALCNKSGGAWSCVPSGDQTNPKVRPTGLTLRK